jgi:hypothetical protein
LSVMPTRGSPEKVHTEALDEYRKQKRPAERTEES